MVYDDIIESQVTITISLLTYNKEEKQVLKEGCSAIALEVDAKKGDRTLNIEY